MFKSQISDLKSQIRAPHRAEVRGSGAGSNLKSVPRTVPRYEAPVQGQISINTLRPRNTRVQTCQTSQSSPHNPHDRSGSCPLAPAAPARPRSACADGASASKPGSRLAAGPGSPADPSSLPEPACGIPPADSNSPVLASDSLSLPMSWQATYLTSGPLSTIFPEISK